MSLIDKPNTTVLVQLRTPVKGAHGTTYQNVGDPVEKQYRVIPVSSTEAQSNGLNITTMKRIITRAENWPGDYASQLIIGTQTWEPIGDHIVYNNSAATEHVEISIKLVSRG